jgi:hypothetical protein
MRTIVILLLLLSFSCKRNFTCVCSEVGQPNGGTLILSSETINDTKKNAQKECNKKLEGDEVGCQLKSN